MLLNALAAYERTPVIVHELPGKIKNKKLAQQAQSAIFNMSKQDTHKHPSANNSQAFKDLHRLMQTKHLNNRIYRQN